MLLAFIIAAAVDTAKLPEPGSPVSVGWLVLSAAALIAAANQFDDFLQRRKSKPPAGELQLTAAGLQERVKSLEDNYEAISSELASTRAALIEDSDERRRAIYSKIDELRLETKQDLTVLRTEMTAELRQHNHVNEQRAGEIHNRVNQILSAVSEVRGQLLKS